jgi:hypothetical protein
VASKVSIVNSALIRIGSDIISSLTEDSEGARLANNIFNESLDYLLQLHPWGFAQVETALALSATPPIYSYTYAYQLPTLPYCLQVTEVEDNIEYEIKGRYLYTDESPVNISYTKRVTDMNELSAAFIQAFSFYLASQLALPLTHDKGMADTMEMKYQFAFQKAKTRESQETRYRKMPEVTWITIRR